MTSDATATTSNRFFVWPYGAHSAEEVDPRELRATDRMPGLRYYAGVLTELDRMLGPRDQRFLLTWNLDAFDVRFRDAVVILIGDEKHQIPSWAREARAVFKTGGTGRNPPRAVLALPPVVAWRVALRDARDLALAARRAARRPRRGQRPPICELPLGTYALVDVPWVAFGDRSADVFFAGSIGARRRGSVRPRVASRDAMTTALGEVRTALPQLRVDSAAAASARFGAAALPPETYSERLMQAKVALCPRGNFDETFRLFEAANSGCVIVSEPLPERWYYADCPAVQISDWRRLGPTLRQLFASEDELEDIARRTAAWWRDGVAERPVAEFIGARLAGV